MNVKRFWLLAPAVLLVLMLLGGALFVTHASAAGQKYRWDIISVDFATGTVNPGGIASAIAQDCQRQLENHAHRHRDVPLESRKATGGDRRGDLGNVHRKRYVRGHRLRELHGSPWHTPAAE